MDEVPRPKKKRLYMFRELFSFMRVKKKWWLLPVFIMIVVAALIIIFGQSSAISPFIYALF